MNLVSTPGTGIQFIFQQTTIYLGIQKLDAPGWFQSDGLGQVKIAREYISQFTLALLFEKIPIRA